MVQMVSQKSLLSPTKDAFKFLKNHFLSFLYNRQQYFFVYKHWAIAHFFFENIGDTFSLGPYAKLRIHTEYDLLLKFYISNMHIYLKRFWRIEMFVFPVKYFAWVFGMTRCSHHLLFKPLALAAEKYKLVQIVPVDW